MRVFVAGGTGQLGLATIPHLVSAGHEVHATARGEEGTARVRALGAATADVDLFDPQALRAAVEGFDAVLRLTTKIPPMTRMRSRRSWEANNRLRTEGARVLVDAVLDAAVPRYVSESVAFVYAAKGDSWITEDDAVDSAGTPVLEAALASEREAARVTAAGRAGVVLRFGSFYSETSEQTRAIAGMARRKLFPVMGDGESFAASIAVPDAGRAVALALDVAPGTYNVVDDEPVRYADYVQAFVEAVDGPRPLRIPAAVGKATLGTDVAGYLLRSLRVSNRRFKEASGWQPEYPSLREGLAAIAPALR